MRLIVITIIVIVYISGCGGGVKTSIPDVKWPSSPSSTNSNTNSNQPTHSKYYAKANINGNISRVDQPTKLSVQPADTGRAWVKVGLDNWVFVFECPAKSGTYQIVTANPGSNEAVVAASNYNDMFLADKGGQLKIIKYDKTNNICTGTFKFTAYRWNNDGTQTDLTVTNGEFCLAF